MWSPNPSASGLVPAEAGRASSSGAEESLKGPLVWSLAFHIIFLAALAGSSLFSHRGEMWGGGGGNAITIGLVGNLPGIPLPRPDVVTKSRVADMTHGLYQAEPKPKEPETQATPIEKFERNKPPRYITKPSRVLENPETPPPGAIPYGQGGSPSVPYTSFTMAGATAGGLGFTGTGGAFGARFPWYVAAVQRRISSNWLQSTVDPTIQWAPRVEVSFEVARDGTISNIQLVRSSGNATVDGSAIRAIRASSPLDRLPSDYSGSYVNVEFWFDFHR